MDSTASRLHILAIDDDPDDVAFLRLAIDRSDLPIEVTHLEGGAAAVDYLTSHPRDTVPRLVLLDLNMPGMDGFETLTRIRAADELPGTVVIMFSASARPTEIERAYQLGANSYIPKPAMISEWLETVAAIHTHWCVVARLP